MNWEMWRVDQNRVLNEDAAFSALANIYKRINIPFPKKRVVADSSNHLLEIVTGKRRKAKIDPIVDMSFLINNDSDKDFVNLQLSCDDFYVGHDIVGISHFPIEIHVTEEHQLHCITGPAIKYRDGTRAYYYRGNEFPAWWIEQKDLFIIPYIELISDGDLKSMAYEIYGWDRLLVDLNAKLIDKDKDPEIGELYNVVLPSTEFMSSFLKVKCGTGRTIVIPVSNEHKTAFSANMASYPDADYFPLEGRT